MSFVLWLREAGCIRFSVTPAVLMALFSGRLGSRGLTLLHFGEVSELDTLVSGSDNSSFASDFSVSAQLPRAVTECSLYEDILDGIHGLSTFGNVFWYDHNKSADPTNTPPRVRLTLLYANKFLGAALGHLQSDSTHWWYGFCDALLPGMQMALVGTLTQQGNHQQRGDLSLHARREQPRNPAVPDDIRRLLPSPVKGTSRVYPAVEERVSGAETRAAPMTGRSAFLPVYKTGWSARMELEVLRPVVSVTVAGQLLANANAPARIFRLTRETTLTRSLQHVGLRFPTTAYAVSRDTASGREFLLNRPIKRVLSEFIRRTRMSLPEFVELVRCQTAHDYRPNKLMVPAVLSTVCAGYKHLHRLQEIAAEVVKVQVTSIPPPQAVRPPNHGSARERLNVLRKNIRSEQDAWRCLILDKDLLSLWPEVVVSPFGVVDKAGGDPTVSGRTIHDLSYPPGTSVNDLTDQTTIEKPVYRHCDAIATEIMKASDAFPDSEVALMLGDVASAFRNISIPSDSVHWFAGTIEEEEALIIELAAPFGWTGSPGSYEIVGGAISYVHGRHTNSINPAGIFNYHWVDDHVNVAAKIGLNCADMERSLRFAMVSVLGAAAINEDKFSDWASSQNVLGLRFDTVARTVSMAQSKINKARSIVASTFHSSSLSRKAYRSLLGSLRHVATCVRSARPFLQRLQHQESLLNRFTTINVTNDMKEDLRWWWLVLHSPHLNGVSLEYFNTLPQPDVIVEVDASDYGLCALDVSSSTAL
ncbi:hypothetical protein PHMEG_00027034, partial [Phytophthora megakarya]